MSPFDRFVCLLPPSLQWVPWPLLRSPAVPHLHRYYGVVRLLNHLSVLPSVDPWLHVSLDPIRRRSSWCERRWGALLGSRPTSLETCRGLETPPISAQPRISGCCRILPSAILKTSASVRDTISVLILTACFLAVYASHPPVAQ
jgi:hypothetical protein